MFVVVEVTKKKVHRGSNRGSTPLRCTLQWMSKVTYAPLVLLHVWGGSEEWQRHQFIPFVDSEKYDIPVSPAGCF
jgi:hypothetical protein